MDAWWARLLLVLDGQWRDLSSRVEAVDWRLAPGGVGLLLAGLLVGAGLAVLCYWRTTEGVQPRVRVILGLLRFGAVACLAVVAAGTVARIQVIRDVRPELRVVVDDSASMELRHGTQTRRELAEAALAPGGPLAHLRQDFDVRVMPTSEVLGQTTARDLPQNLAEALVRAATAASPGWPPAHLLLLSDGVQVDRQPLAAAAPLVGAPVSALSFGNGEQVRDLVLQGLVAPGFVFLGDRAVVTAQVRAYGLTGDVAVRLARLDGTTSQDLTTVKATPSPDGAPTPVRLEFVADQPGRQRYAVTVGPGADELTDANNTQRFYLDVRTERIRVLFVEGQPGWEYRAAKAALETDPAVAFHGLLRLPPDEWFYQGPEKRADGQPVLRHSKSGFPDSLEELAYFDVLILGDLERKTFEEAKRFDLVDLYVRERGGGLGTIGGLSVYSAGHYEDTALARLLPLRLTGEKKTQLVNRFNVKLTPTGMMHPIMQLESQPQQNEEAWAGLPWVEGGNAFSRVKPSATTLLVHPTLRTRYGPRPLAAAWECGRGRVFSTALDGTWHWSMARKTETDYHRRYWGLLVRWLAGDPRVQRGNALALESPRCEAGTPVTVAISLRNGAGLPVADAELVAQLTLPGTGSATASLISDPAAPGRYALTFVPNVAGECQVQVEGKLAEGPGVKQDLSFVVEPARAEWLNVRPSEASLQALATATGGKVVRLEDARTLTLPAPRAGSEPGTVVVAVWRAPGLVLLLLVCVMTEWAMRKRRGLA